MTASSMNGVVSGLENVVAATTRLSSVNGQKGELILAGFPLEEIAERISFEEMVFLLWHDRLPTAGELTNFSQQLADLRPLPAATLPLLRAAAQSMLPAMDALRMGAATLDLDLPAQDPMRQAQALVARMPTIVAAYWRLKRGEEPLPPDPALSHSANYLYMLSGEKPGEALVRALDTYLITVSDHGLNASTFTARTIVSTRSDLVSAVTGAIGALKGPLHGGAPGPALDMVFEIGAAERADPFLRSKIEAGERLMGFGHRVYKVRDPRADVLGRAAARLYQADGDMSLYELAKQVEETAVTLLAEYKPGRNLQTNVEFFTALLLHGLGLPTDLFSPTFAVGRAAGWLAHCFEQQQTGRLIRPKSAYSGETGRRWQPVDQRTDR